MADIDTVKSITDNLQGVAQAQGIKFSRETYDDIVKVPASILPHGEIYYTGEEFEYTHGQRSGYAEIEYTLRVVLRETDRRVMMRKVQEWAHKLRDALTVNALNVGDLSASKFVSRVTTEEVTVESDGDVSQMNYIIKVRYREA